MSSWHCHLASDLWEPLEAERLWSTALRPSADSLHVPRLGKAPVQHSWGHVHLGSDAHDACGIELRCSWWQQLL